MKTAVVVLVAGVFLLAYFTSQVTAQDIEEEEGCWEIDENEDDDEGDDWGTGLPVDGDDIIIAERKALKGHAARAGHAKHARAGSRHLHARARAGAKPHARASGARKAAHGH